MGLKRKNVFCMNLSILNILIYLNIAKMEKHLNIRGKRYRENKKYIEVIGQIFFDLFIVFISLFIHRFKGQEEQMSST